ncbi:hypothetical protein A2U01_0090284 [Trifolium medium]|uniref:Uncharacterized protein n=1 Tax=Trifolium medium TaxID=97028 RepID=A0A392U6A2_9FABA|nr:hypothetical protein [Trifolium medium]
MSTALIPKPQASVSKINLSLKFRRPKTGASDIAFFSPSKAVCASSYQLKASRLRSAVNGAANEA